MEIKKCRFCNELKSLSLFCKNRNQNDGFNTECKACVKNYKIQNAEVIKLQARNWIINNREKIRNYDNNKYKNNHEYRLKKMITISIIQSFKYNGFSKKSRTHQILGCSFKEFKQYLESKFEPWMTWENQGLYNGELNYGWDVDHVIPLSSAKTEEDIIRLNHFSNLQPLCSKINRDIKKDKLDYE